MKKKLLNCLILVFVVIGVGCKQYKDVPPNYLAKILTPTGFEETVYTSGQVDIGDVGQDGKQNTLILIQRSGIEVEEKFIGSNTDKEDHRITTKDKLPMTLDVRFLFTLPDHQKQEGAIKLDRIFALGNPVPLPNDNRILTISAKQIYEDQIKLVIRGQIRVFMAEYANYNDAFTAFADQSEKGLNAKLSSALAKALKDCYVPFKIVEAQVSNMKPDDLVVQAQLQSLVADSQIASITKIGKFLNEHPEMREIYKYTALQEIARISSEKGNNFIYLTDIPSNKPTNNTQLPIIKQ